MADNTPASSPRFEETFDYVIVGAGSAGCVLAARLTEDPAVTVKVLEAGGSDNSVHIQMPAAFAEPLMDHRYNWWYDSAPEAHMDHRRMYCPRGKVLGGSSSINGMCYVRGHARDYDRWAQSGLSGWDYAHCLPYFRKAENLDIGGDDYRGGGGPLHVTAGKMTNPLYRAWVEAGRQAGYPVTDDMNGYQQEGVGRMDMTVRAGRRWSAYRAYLKPALKRPNLSLETAALSHHICLFEGRAVGVAYEWHGQRRQVGARREVIVAGGAINSPQLLQLSGIGPGEVLRDAGVAVRHELPGVGRNLQDHLEVYVQMACRQPVSLFPATKPLGRLAVGLRWLATGGGVGASNLFEAGGFIRSRAGIEHPDLQYHFLPVAINYDGSNPRQGHGFQAHVGPMRPTSTGRVAIIDDNPRRPPEIRFNYMATESDRQDMRAGVRLTREIFAQAAFDPFRGDELAPGPELTSDDEIDAFVRAHGESAYHPSCTCKMGPASDGTAVVDVAGQVHGLVGLRVIDASIMPSIVSGNLNAPTIMMAEKLADQLRGRAPLAPSAAAVWIHPAWHSQQR
ncbi:MAG: choline dehydrogenase [Pseudomonadota bacterium]|nr:choline dehydrogenase [Pseudomonadota bacterium]